MHRSCTVSKLIIWDADASDLETTVLLSQSSCYWVLW